MSTPKVIASEVDAVKIADDWLAVSTEGFAAGQAT